MLLPITNIFVENTFITNDFQAKHMKQMQMQYLLWRISIRSVGLKNCAQQELPPYNNYPANPIRWRSKNINQDMVISSNHPPATTGSMA
jgi:hypothetical protein